MPSNRYIPVEEIRRLTLGSYENAIACVDQTAQQQAESLFGKNARVRLIGTFPGSAIVMSEEGDIRRVFYEWANDGTAKLVRSEAVEVPIFSSENVEDFVRKEVSKAVRAWSEGRVEEAQRRIADVAPFIVERPVQDDGKVVESLVVSFKAPRPWKAVYEERRSQIEEMLTPEELQEVREGHLAPKFSLLYDGQLNEEELSGYHDLVEADLSYLETRVTSLRDLVEASYSASRSVVESECKRGTELFTVFRSFTEDLISDLQRIGRVVAESRRKISRIDCLGRLYDAIVEDLSDYEVSGRFVSAMCERFKGVSL